MGLLDFHIKVLMEEGQQVFHEEHQKLHPGWTEPVWAGSRTDLPLDRGDIGRNNIFKQKKCCTGDRSKKKKKRKNMRHNPADTQLSEEGEGECAPVSCSPWRKRCGSCPLAALGGPQWSRDPTAA